MKKAIYSIPQTYSFAIVPILPIAGISGTGSGASGDGGGTGNPHEQGGGKPARL